MAVPPIDVENLPEKSRQKLYRVLGLTAEASVELAEQQQQSATASLLGSSLQSANFLSSTIVRQAAVEAEQHQLCSSSQTPTDITMVFKPKAPMPLHRHYQRKELGPRYSSQRSETRLSSHASLSSTSLAQIGSGLPRTRLPPIGRGRLLSERRRSKSSMVPLPHIVTSESTRTTGKRDDGCVDPQEGAAGCPEKLVNSESSPSILMSCAPYTMPASARPSLLSSGREQSPTECATTGPLLALPNQTWPKVQRRSVRSRDGTSRFPWPPRVLSMSEKSERSRSYHRLTRRSSSAARRRLSGCSNTEDSSLDIDKSTKSD